MSGFQTFLPLTTVRAGSQISVRAGLQISSFINNDPNKPAPTHDLNKLAPTDKTLSPSDALRSSQKYG
ncbi:hypothetical protein NIES2100_11220 [Calothrix sp. NIES-2100]|nr:hypothetical protein NIES2100_11220 [Calothrix sp. NIES-2100]